MARAEIPAGSDRYDDGFAAGRANQPFHADRVTCENHGFVAQCDRYHDGVNHTGRSSHRQQAPCLVRIVFAHRHDGAASQEAAELGLLRGPAHLGDDRRRNQWNNAQLQTSFVFSPRLPDDGRGA